MAGRVFDFRHDRNGVLYAGATPRGIVSVLHFEPQIGSLDILRIRHGDGSTAHYFVIDTWPARRHGVHRALVERWIPTLHIAGVSYPGFRLSAGSPSDRPFSVQ